MLVFFWGGGVQFFTIFCEFRCLWTCITYGSKISLYLWGIISELWNWKALLHTVHLYEALNCVVNAGDGYAEIETRCLSLLIFKLSASGTLFFIKPSWFNHFFFQKNVPCFALMMDTISFCLTNCEDWWEILTNWKRDKEHFD